MKTILILILFATFSATATFAADEPPTKEDLIAALKQDPSDQSALYNLGLLNYLEDNYAEAIKHWQTLRTLEPTDWRVREKLVQAYWGAGDTKAATTEIAALREARDSKKHPELSKKEFFICDQFQIGTIRAFVLEYYDLKGDRPLAWKFILRTGDEDVDHRYSVGSYDTATAVARELGTIGPNERQYHLDGYWTNGSHATYGFYRNRPDYQNIRTQVQQIIKGEMQPISSFTPPATQDKSGDAAKPAK
ncbi:tetratricopeptide repeat protein [Prosthecobacter sp.]|uniref:tetratricopeptide repeat protein n=1 Tax=Prosthecobacter sp. TaxID=1965333 RepID=UPI003783A465